MVKKADVSSCLVRREVAEDAQTRLRAFAEKEKSLADDPPEDDSPRKLDLRELPDVDGDGDAEIVVEDIYGGTANRPLFLYVSNGGCFRPVFEAFGAFVFPRKSKHGAHADLAFATKQTSCTQPDDRIGYRVATLQWTAAGYRPTRSVACPCDGAPGKVSADCPTEWP